MFTQMTCEELRAKQSSGDKIVLLDVREQFEFDEAHIDGTLLIPLGELEDRIEELAPYKDQELVVICRSGNRSTNACLFLDLKGFTKTYNLQGGMLEWL